MTTELLPCPFCGDDQPALDHEADTGAWSVRCTHCGITIGNYAGERSALSAWSRRTSPTTPTEGPAGWIENGKWRPNPLWSWAGPQTVAWSIPLYPVFPSSHIEPVAWQERQARRMANGVVTEWSRWYECKGPIEETRAEAPDHIPHEWRPLYASPTTPTEGPAQPWRCFHCDEAFSDAEQARLHFGDSERQRPSCQVSPEELRELEAELARYREEDTDLHRALHRKDSDHQQALMREEEKGYARGLRDGMDESKVRAGTLTDPEGAS